MRIFLTGGAGFIGSCLSKQLLDQGHQVLIFDQRKTDTIDPRAVFVQGKVSDSALLKQNLPGYDIVIHMASLLEVNESTKKPLLYADNNILGSISLLEAMLEVSVKKIVFSSSATVYGFSKTLPFTEDLPTLAVNPYGATKIAVENFLSSYHFIHGFDVTILRYFNPYGPFENHLPETHAIPNFIKSGLAKQSVPLYWKGEQKRDFIYIEDLAAAHVAVLNLNGWNIFNVGTNNGVRVIDVVHTISKILGYNLSLDDKGERAGDVMETYASSKKLEAATGWIAKTSLEDGLKSTIEWFKSSSIVSRK